MKSAFEIGHFAKDSSNAGFLSVRRGNEGSQNFKGGAPWPAGKGD